MFAKLFSLFRRAKPLAKTKPRGRHWEHIGRITYGEKEGDVPRWVLDAEREIHRKYGGTSSSLLNKFFYIKGRHFEYRISYAGQGGPIVEIERRKRRGG